MSEKIYRLEALDACRHVVGGYDTVVSDLGGSLVIKAPKELDASAVEKLQRDVHDTFRGLNAVLVWGDVEFLRLREVGAE